MMTSVEKLCEDCPKCFKDYINYCKKLKFSEKPNYDYLKKLFIDEINKNKYVCMYEWMSN
jgi:hypothetical protein